MPISSSLYSSFVSFFRKNNVTSPHPKKLLYTSHDLKTLVPASLYLLFSSFFRKKNIILRNLRTIFNTLQNPILLVLLLQSIHTLLSRYKTIIRSDSATSLSTSQKHNQPRKPVSSLYRPLNRDLDEIRLLRLYPRHHPSDLPSCSLFQTQSDDSNWQDHQSDLVLESRLLFQQERKYNALSYAWGSSARLSPILVNGVEVMVTANLAKCLRQLTSNMEAESQQSTFLWVDAICINQKDLIEQAIEVKRMGMIYSSAETVIVWIGEPMIESDAPALREILLELDQTRGDIEPRLIDSEWSVWSNENSARVLHQFFSKKWWRRTWVFQEIVLAKSIRLHYGNLSFTWDSFNNFPSQAVFPVPNVLVRSVMIPCEVSEALCRVLIINDVRFSRASGCKVRLIELLHMDRCSFCSDPRDRIYGLLGLAEDQDDFNPDYTKPVQLVFQDVVESLIKKERSLNILCMLANSNKIDGLPSWVPDFTESLGTRELIHFYSKDQDERHKFMASGTMTFSGVRVEAGVLSAEGLILDIVDGIGEATDVAQLNPPEKLTLPSPSGHASLQQSTTDKSRYTTRDDLLHALWNTLVSSRQLWDTKATSASQTLYIMFDSVAIPKEKWPLKDIWDWDNLDDIRSFYAKNATLKFAGRSFSDWINIAIEVFESNFDASVDDLTEEITNLPFHIFNTLESQRLLVTASGYIGYVPDETRRGDKICILYGMDVPVVLRPNQDGTYELIGPCYVHGVMEGELMDDMQNGVFEERVFNIA